MAKTDQKALTARSEDQSKWYTEVVQRAKLADYSPVRGCMVIRPYGYALWENIQAGLDKMIKAAGVQNAYFPLFIPYSFLEKEADHVEGFAPEVAVVTHAGGKELEEKLVVRPTSETIIYSMYKDWVQSYRDLPILINQWANVVRWEKRTQPFLRTTEFLWQEGHTIHATQEEAREEVVRALEMYHDFARDYLAMYTIKGYKTDAEKFPGADYTVSIEALMGDNKALQSGTSHALSQEFAKSFDVSFVDENGEQQYVWPTSWGVSTRLIGGVILMHGDDKGLVIPPNIASTKVIIVPIYKSDTEAAVREHVEQVETELKKAAVGYEVDWSDNTPGFKFSEAEMRGIPIRLEVGPKDVEAKSAMMVSRFDGEKESVELANVGSRISERLDELHLAMLEKSKTYANQNTAEVKDEKEFYRMTDSEEPVGYIRCFFSGDKDAEQEIKEKTKYTTRNIPLETSEQEGKCIFTGEPGKLTLFARAY